LCEVCAVCAVCAVGEVCDDVCGNTCKVSGGEGGGV
jgi:hypothetical protein